MMTEAEMTEAEMTVEAETATEIKDGQKSPFFYFSSDFF
jgi:hypothetical protein